MSDFRLGGCKTLELKHDCRLWPDDTGKCAICGSEGNESIEPTQDDSCTHDILIRIIDDSYECFGCRGWVPAAQVIAED